MISQPSLSFDLRFSKYDIFAEKRSVSTTLYKIVNSKYKTVIGECSGTREELEWKNIREANSEGYSGPLAVWRSLVEHELLHSLVGEIIFGGPSRVMLAESGVEFTPLWERYEEESLCLALQFYFNTGTSAKILHRYEIDPVLNILSAWKRIYEPSLSSLWQ